MNKSGEPMSPTKRTPPSIPSSAPQISDALRQRLANITQNKQNNGQSLSAELSSLMPKLSSSHNNNNSNNQNSNSNGPPRINRTVDTAGAPLRYPPRRPTLTLAPNVAVPSREATASAEAVLAAANNSLMARKQVAQAREQSPPISQPPSRKPSASATVMPPIVARKISAANFARPPQATNTATTTSGNTSARPGQSNSSSANSTMKVYRTEIPSLSNNNNSSNSTGFSNGNNPYGERQYSSSSPTNGSSSSSINQFQKPAMRMMESNNTTPPRQVTTSKPHVKTSPAVNVDSGDDTLPRNMTREALAEQNDRIKLLESARAKLRVAQSPTFQQHRNMFGQSRSPSQPSSPLNEAASPAAVKPQQRPMTPRGTGTQSPRRKQSIDDTNAKRYTSENEMLNATVERLTRELFEQRQLADKLQAQIKADDGARDRQAMALQDCKTRESSLQASVKQLQYELLQVRNDVETERAALRHDHVHIDQVEAMREEHARALQTVGEEAELLRVKFEEAQHGVEVLRRDVSEAERQLETAEQRHQTERQRTESQHEKQVAELRRQIDDLTADLQESQQQASDAQRETQQANATVGTVREELRSAQRQSSDATQRADELALELEIAQMDVGSLRTKLAAAQDECDKLAAENLAAKASAPPQSNNNSNTNPSQSGLLSDTEATELFEVLEQLQRENQLLRTSMQERANKRQSVLPSAATAAAINQQQQQSMVKYLEDYVSDLTAAFADLETERNQLAAQLEEATKNSKPDTAASDSNEKQSPQVETRYLSTDAELLSFIELMSAKVKTYSDQVDQLVKENQELKAESGLRSPDPHRDRQGSMQEDSAYNSSRPGSPNMLARESDEKTRRAVQDLRAQADADAQRYRQRETVLRRDLDAALDRERLLQSDFNGLCKEFDRLSNTIADFSSEKHQLTTLVERLRGDIQSLQQRLHEEMSKNFGMSGDLMMSTSVAEPPSTAELRSELRRQLERVRADFSRDLNKEIQLRDEAEKVVRALKREREMEAYGKVHQTCQTVDSLLMTPL